MDGSSEGGGGDVSGVKYGDNLANTSDSDLNGDSSSSRRSSSAATAGSREHRDRDDPLRLSPPPIRAPGRSTLQGTRTAQGTTPLHDRVSLEAPSIRGSTGLRRLDHDPSLFHRPQRRRAGLMQRGGIPHGIQHDEGGTARPSVLHPDLRGHAVPGFGLSGSLTRIP